MRLATRIWILAAIVWLFGLGLCPMQAFASKSRMTASLGPFARIAYDGQTQPSIAYDGSSLPSSDYDSASSRITNESENRRAGSTGVFGHFAKFLAAETAQSTRLLDATLDPLPMGQDVLDHVVATDPALQNVSLSVAPTYTPYLGENVLGQATRDTAIDMHIIRATGAGTEYYFSPNAYQLFK